MMLEQVSMVEGAPDFPAAGRDDVELANLLVTRALTIPLPHGGETLACCLLPPLQLRDPRSVLAGRMGDHPVLLSIEADRLTDFLPDLAAGARLDVLPGALAMAVAEVAFRPLLDALAEALAAPFVLEALHGPPPTDWFRIGVTPAGTGAILATLHLSPPAAGAVAGVLSALPAAPSWDAAAATRVPLIAQIGSIVLGLSQIAALEYGDVLLLPPGSSPLAVEILAGSGARRIGTARYEGSTVTIERLSEAAMLGDEKKVDETAPADDGDAASRAVAVDDIEVRLDFSLGQRLVSVAELRTLGPGYTFELAPPNIGEVGILANGREVGRGALVKIEDRLGVRILRLSETSDA